jgi:hypothetical protein
MENKEIDPDVQHIFDSGANELRVDELLKRRERAAYNLGVEHAKNALSASFRQLDKLQSEYNKTES